MAQHVNHTPAASAAGAPSFVVRRAARSAWVGPSGFSLVTLVLIVLPFVVYQSITGDLITFFVLVALASMWNLLAGFGGLISIGQQAFIGIGAYTVIGLADLGVNPFVAVIFAIITSALFAWPTSWLAFRLRGDYFAVGTWVIAEVYRLIISRMQTFGGPSGKPLMGIADMDRTLRAAATYWMALAVAVACVIGCYLLLRGRTGLALTAMRDDEIAAAAGGVDIARAKRLVFLTSAAGCGAAGAVLTLNALSVQPNAIFDVKWSAYMIFIVVIGGIGYIEGPILGAIVFYGLQSVMADYGSWYLIVLGLVAMLTAIYLPRGLWGWVYDRTRWRLFPVGYFVRRESPGG